MLALCTPLIDWHGNDIPCVPCQETNCLCAFTGSHRNFSICTGSLGALSQDFPIAPGLYTWGRPVFDWEVCFPAVRLKSVLAGNRQAKVLKLSRLAAAFMLFRPLQLVLASALLLEETAGWASQRTAHYVAAGGFPGGHPVLAHQTYTVFAAGTVAVSVFLSVLLGRNGGCCISGSEAGKVLVCKLAGSLGTWDKGVLTVSRLSVSSSSVHCFSSDGLKNDHCLHLCLCAVGPSYSACDWRSMQAAWSSAGVHRPVVLIKIMSYIAERMQLQRWHGSDSVFVRTTQCSEKYYWGPLQRNSWKKGFVISDFVSHWDVKHAVPGQINRQRLHCGGHWQEQSAYPAKQKKNVSHSTLFRLAPFANNGLPASINQPSPVSPLRSGFKLTFSIKFQAKGHLPTLGKLLINICLIFISADTKSESWNVSCLLWSSAVGGPVSSCCVNDYCLALHEYAYY